MQDKSGNPIPPSLIKPQQLEVNILYQEIESLKVQLANALHESEETFKVNNYLNI